MSSLSEAEKQQLRDDDANWKFGLLYFCPRDPGFLVPKRVGIGWTVNCGSGCTLVALVGLLAVIAWGGVV